MRRPTLVFSAIAAAVVFTQLTTGLAWSHPGSGIVIDRRGNVYFVDTGQGVLKIGPGGRLTPHPGPAYHWMTIDASDRFARARLPSFSFGEIVQAGVNPTLILGSDFPVAVGHDGNLYYPLLSAEKRLQIIKLTPTGQSTVLITLPPSTDDSRPLRWVNGMAAGAYNAIYFTESDAIRKVAQNGTVSTVATIRPVECSRIPGIDEEPKPYLRGLDVDAQGAVYVAASGCGSLLKVLPNGRVDTLLRTQSPWSPTGVAVSGAGVYVLEYLHTASENRREWLPRVRKLSPNGKVVTIASIEHR